MTYPEAIQYLESFINYENISLYPYKGSFQLGRIRGFLETIDNPHKALRCIHVAGSKGKGSTCAFIAYTLREAGCKVGLYTSPHLSDFRERIRILSHKSGDPRYGVGAPSHKLNRGFEGMISKAELKTLVERLSPAIKQYNKSSRHGQLSFFEVYTALAFVYFEEKKVDFVVLETGLGGRLDATNVVNPLVCVITPISYEHTQKLGHTLKEITGEKAGIIRPGPGKLIVISAPQKKEAIEVIRKKCKGTGATLYEVGKDIISQETKFGFEVKGLLGEYPDLKIRLIGRHQLMNATVAISAIEALRLRTGINIDVYCIRTGLSATVWPARCEVVSRHPLVLLDGAQNVASSRVLKEAVRENFKYKKLILVLGISNDKDIKGICRELSDLADEIILTRSGNPRAALPELLAANFGGRKLYLTDNVRDAREQAYSVAGKQDLILVCGSLFLAGEFRNE